MSRCCSAQTLRTLKSRREPTREQAQNKLLYAAPVTLAESGKWQLAVTIFRNGERTDATGTIDVAPAPEMAASYWSYIAFPPLMIAALCGPRTADPAEGERVKRCEISWN